MSAPFSCLAVDTSTDVCTVGVRVGDDVVVRDFPGSRTGSQRIYAEIGDVLNDASVTLDAYPGETFDGVVTEVGNSAIRTQIGLGQSSVDFKVVVSIEDPIPNVRPGLSASAKIKVAEETDVLSIPIQCLTIRQPSDLATAETDTTAVTTADDEIDIEGCEFQAVSDLVTGIGA